VKPAVADAPSAAASATTKAGWRDRWHDLRNRLLADPRFRYWAARLPLTRGISRRRARAVFDLCAGFVYSQVLMTCVRLNLFERLRPGARSLEQLARDCALPPAGLERLLLAAVALDLLERRAGNRYALGVHGAALIDNPAVLAMTRHHGLLYADLADLVPLLEGTAPPTHLQRYWAYATTSPGEASQPGQVADYSQLMTASQALVAEQVLAVHDVRGHRHLLDIGGGEGAFAIAMLQAAPRLTATVFDLAPVAARAAARMQVAGLRDRVRCIGGDFRADALPVGADLVTLVRVLHDHDDGVARRLVEAAAAVVEPGGTVLIAEPMSGVAGAEPVGDAYFGLYLLAMRQGRPRTAGEYEKWLAEAGMQQIRRLSTPQPLLASVIVARRPPGPVQRLSKTVPPKV